MTNKYLEKIALVIPRNLKRLAQEGFSGMKSKALSANARSASDGAKKVVSEAVASKAEFNRKVVSNMVPPSKRGASSLYGNASINAERAKATADAAGTRATRSQKADTLRSKAFTGARKTVGSAAAGVSTAGAAGILATKKDSK